jgi:hypothetical protein
MFIKNLYLKIPNGISTLNLKNKEPNKELVEHLRDHLKCSSKESKEAIAMLDTAEISRILTNRGLDKKEQKLLLK